MRSFLVILFLLITLPLFAQNNEAKKDGYVQGIISDGKLKEPIPFATVALLKTDSTIVSAISADSIGQFKLAASPNKYILDISFMGYKRHQQNITVSKENPNLDLGKIYLKDQSILLNEAVVVAEVPAIVVKGDTIEYNSSAYKTEENALLSDLIKEIPGMEVDDNGNITANGKPVKKILVDGKEFFGNDIPLALANLPASMIKKLQLFKEESETAKVTGFKDKDPDQVLNLVVDDALKENIFGNVKAGYASSDRYSNRLIANYMKGEAQASVVGNLNNISDGYGGGSSGEEKERSVGGNVYISPKKGMNVGGYIRLSEDENKTITRSNTQTYLENGDYLSKQESTNINKQSGANTGFNFDWKIDTLTTIYARSNIRLSNTDNINRSSGLSYYDAGNKVDTTKTSYNNRTKGDNYNINSSMTIGRKLNSKGRTVSLSLNHSVRRGEDNGTNNSETHYTGTTPSILLDQKLETTTKYDSYGFSLSYVEPLGKNNLLQLSYNFNKNKSDRDKETWRKDAAGDYTVIDSAYTRETSNEYLQQSIGLNFQSNKEKYSFTIGFSIDPSKSSSNIHLGDSVIEDLKQDVVNFSPSLNFSYTPNQTSSLSVSYSGSTSQPTISQLSADTTIVNPSLKYYGNPGLKPSYSNNLNMHYQKSNYEVGNFMVISGGANYTFNNIASYTIIDKLGNSENTYRNVDGNMGANFNFTYNTPLKNKKFTINTSSYVNYYRNVGFTNEKKAITNNIVLNQMASLRFKSKKFESHIMGRISHSITKNNLSNVEDRKTTTYGFRNNTILKLPYDFSINNRLDYSRFAGYGDDFKKSELLWNASITKLFLKNKKGAITLDFFDILDDRNNLSRVVTSTYASDTYTNSINRYFMLSFSYKFNFLKGNKAKPDNDDYYYDDMDI